jgi:hypothetical protein
MKKLRDLPRTLPELPELTHEQLAVVVAGDGCSSGNATVDYSNNMCREDQCNDAIGLHDKI